MFLMGWTAFRSVRLSGIALVPKLLPVMGVVGTMGWIGLPVNIATAMLASVAMGMSIGTSILYIYRFERERRGGVEFTQALMQTHCSTGLALIIANVAMVLGFMVLMLSRFIPLVHFGMLTALALFGGLVGNLVLLPLLLWLAAPRQADVSDGA
jgi:predicted RND superfamily exporter protein